MDYLRQQRFHSADSDLFANLDDNQAETKTAEDYKGVAYMRIVARRPESSGQALPEKPHKNDKNDFVNAIPTQL